MEDGGIYNAQPQPDKPPSQQNERKPDNSIQQHSWQAADGRESELKSPPSNGNATNPKKKRRYTRDPGMFWLGVITLIVVGMYAWYAREQAIATEKAALAAKQAADTASKALEASIESFRQQNRPYVTAETIRINEKPRGGLKIGIEAVLRNTGTTPAFNLRASQTFDPQSDLPCSMPELKIDPALPSVDVGSGNVRAIRVFGERALTEGEAALIKPGGKAVCYAALIQFDSVFEGDMAETGEIELCSFYKAPLPSASVGEGDLFLWSCPGHESRIRWTKRSTTNNRTTQ